MMCVTDELVYLARAELLGGCTPENVRRALQVVLEAALTPQGAVGEIVGKIAAHRLDVCPDWDDKQEHYDWSDEADDLLGKAADLITTLSARITTLEAERDEAVGRLDEARSLHNHQATLATAAEAEVKRLRTALRDIADSPRVDFGTATFARAALAEDWEAK